MQLKLLVRISVDIPGEDLEACTLQDWRLWLLTDGVSPVPLAALVHLSEDEWNASVFAVHTETLMFSILTTQLGETFEAAKLALQRGRIGFPGLPDRIMSLKALYDADYMTKIRSTLFIPVHGRPGMTFHFLTTSHIHLSGAGLVSGVEQRPLERGMIGLSVDEIFALRLAAERFMAAFNDIWFDKPAEVQPLPHPAPIDAL
jgi:hypothetical protein